MFSRSASGVEFTARAEPADDTQFAVAGDRLVRHLFDVGLQLHALRVVFEQCTGSDLDRRAARDAVTGMLDDLDLLIGDSNLAMLVLESGEHRE
ncbi:MAG: hypothetical protein JWN03_3155 [Nocardia sp.]|nr:hypothetical protein [Nocardia sp.]